MNQLDARDRFLRLQSRGETRLETGDLDGALAAYTEAIEAARETGDVRLEERAYCNRAAIAITLGDTSRPIDPLRRILMANTCQENAFLAAYTIARSYEYQKNHKKGLFYARIARDRAQTLERADWLAATLNQMGNFMVAECRFDEAREAYDSALGTMPAERADLEHQFELNLGYCQVMRGDVRDGLRRIYRGFRWARATDSPKLEAQGHLDLCYALLEVGKLQAALRHGVRGLAMAEAMGDADWVKNGLYLLGEIAIQLGDGTQAEQHFTQLQQRYYPDQPFITDFLMSVDVRPLINLRA